MSIVLYHHMRSRAATTVWMLEEVGQPYADRLAARPALERADAVNARVTAEHGLTPPGA